MQLLYCIYYAISSRPGFFSFLLFVINSSLAEVSSCLFFSLVSVLFFLLYNLPSKVNLTENMYTDLCQSGAQETPHDEPVPLQLGLYDDESKVGLRVHVARHLFDPFDLGFYPVR